MAGQDKIILLDRDVTNAWDGNGDPIGTTDLPSSTDPEMTQDGDMVPWRVRLEMTNTGVTGEVNYGVLKLRIDEEKTFVQSGPLLMDEDAKNNYLIEAYITQNDDTGTERESKRFRFQLGTPTLDLDEHLGVILTITLQEIQYRMKEVPSARELRFTTPFSALGTRISDFNSHQTSSVSPPVGVNISIVTNNLPNVEELQQHYIPQSPQTTQILIDNIFENLSQPNPVGGVFTDFYYDFDPVQSTLTTNLIADEIGRVDSGAILDPLSSETPDTETEQSASTDFVRYKNHVIMRGSPNGGSLPTDHSIFSSKWEHAKLRPEWDSTRVVQDRNGDNYNYLKGQTVKITYDTGISGVDKVVRYFMALRDVSTSGPNPATSTDDWEEDFTTTPEFDNTGSYEINDVVYFNPTSEYRFYRAKINIRAFTLNGFRQGKDNTDPKWGSYLKPDGRLRDPDQDPSFWEDISTAHSGGGDVVPAHSTDSFTGFETFSPWTQSVFDWEKNMIALKSGSLVGATGDTFVGAVPDWNMAKDVYDRQDITDQFESITMKWVRKVGVNDVVSSGATATELNSDEKYHGQRVIVGTTPTTEFTTDYNNQFSSGTPNNRLAEYDTNGDIWRFSRLPIENDFITNLDEGNIYYWDGSSWVIGWEIERKNTPDSGNNSAGNPSAAGAYSHPVKDIYKVKGFEGTPSHALEFRYVWDTTLLANIPTPLDNDAQKTKLARLASRGTWLWFWNPFPRLPIGETTPTKDVGDLFGGNGNTASPKTGFTTLNIYNNNSDRFQSIRGWNNGLNTEDMGKISGLSFRLKVGIFGDSVEDHNDLNFDNLSAPIIGLESIPMIFWAIDDFDRIWTKKFTLRRNNRWDLVDIEFGDLSVRNLYIPRWDELINLLGVPLSALDFLLEEREYTGVKFDWRFVRGWGVMYSGAYDDTGFYNGGIDDKRDQLEAVGSQLEHVAESVATRAHDIWTAINNAVKTGNVDSFKEIKTKSLATTPRQATIAIDDLYYKKEMVVNSNDSPLDNARTSIEFSPNQDDYINTKALARGKRERLSFFPQFWHFRSIGDTRIRVGQRFTIIGDRIPDKPDLYSDWDSGTVYSAGQKVKFNNYAWIALTSTSAGESPTTNPTKWDNLNQLSCSSVKHIIDGTGYHVEVDGRRKFTVGV